MKHNSYFGMAESDYLFAKASLDNCKAIGIYNSAVAVLAQAAEKYLKAVVEKCLPDDSESLRLLRSHNLRAILTKIKVRFPDIRVDSMECKWLGDFYFDARYPGDDFVEVPLEDALRCVKITEDIRREALRILGVANTSAPHFEAFEKL